MQFKKYTSIENSYRDKVTNNMLQYFPTEQFIVQEKIHGSNFAFYVDESGVRCAKRSGFIPDDQLEGFFNSDILLSQCKGKLENIFKTVGSFSIHGEICGGSYPHNDVPVNNEVSSVQRGVFYSPNREFVAFDMKLNEDYVDLTFMNQLLDFEGIPRSQILFSGTLKECLEYPNEFNSKVPASFGLPELDENICEGVVIKSIAPKRLPNGERLILKNKNAKWSEKSKVKKTKTELPEHIQTQRNIIESFVTENRLRNVLSKLGPITDQKKAFGQIMQPFILDVIEDYTKENPEFLELDKKERGLVTKAANAKTAEIIRGNLFNIIDGNF